MRHTDQIIAALFGLLAGTLGSADAFAVDQSVLRHSGFSETRIPQVNGNVPIRKNSNLEKANAAKTLTKQNSSDTTQNGTVSCGPENAQSDICRKMIQHR
ncbi:MULTISPECIES: hypothetical protein [unclassified Rhizobium]|uniref:hypothetical protein n=1 Tax=unclassified Rhizobium TaxID=2613769 RepID=UPI003805BEFC